MNLSERVLNGEELDEAELIALLDPEMPLLPLLHEAYVVRSASFGNRVQVHVLNNARNARCPEDCGYCSQSAVSDAPLQPYEWKSNEEILSEAREAYRAGAFRYCVVASGRGPTNRHIKRLAEAVRLVKKEVPVEVCVSVGLVDEEAARLLKDAGVDRLNHNLNTSESHYDKICSTHDYQDRLQTLAAAQSVGLQMCSGLIVGLGEQDADIAEVATQLRRLKVPSIPVNFLIPIDGNPVQSDGSLSPQRALRVLAMMRLANPRSEIRVAGGREGHLRGSRVDGAVPRQLALRRGLPDDQGSRLCQHLSNDPRRGFRGRARRRCDRGLGRVRARRRLPDRRLDRDSQARGTGSDLLNPYSVAMAQAKREVKIVEVGDAISGTLQIGPGLPLAWIVGPCVIEDQALMANAAERLKKLSEKLDIPMIFKSSFEKDNRSSETSYQGPGLDEGLEILAWVRKEFELPVISDVHRVEDLEAAREVLDVIQIPAFLCQQTSLIIAAAKTGKPVNVKKGQFLAPSGMFSSVGKIERAGNDRILLTERGASFGYNDLVADMTAIPVMKEFGYPVIFDAGHQVRRYGISSDDPAGGSSRDFIPVLLRSAIAAGANGIFLEAHPNPAEAACDAASQFPLDELEVLLVQAKELAELMREQGHA